jgi:D-alanyl-D-alanine carboxypeptidase
MVAFVCLAQAVRAAPYADMVMDARSGEVLHATNADSRLHPASLTKMMTLYIAFEAIRLGEISLDTMVTISPKAAAEPPSKLGLRAGQKIQLRYLIRAAAVKSANDAATAIGEAIGGSEAAFARRMNRTARALGMTRTTFQNAHGLTQSGHLSTARDMTILGRHLFYDYPQYYNIFSRRSADAGVGEVANTNRRFLDAYEGADGIKTGFTRAAGFNLVASAQRGNVRIIATVFGGQSTPHRNARMAELMDLGFKQAPRRVAVSRPNLPDYDRIPDEEPAQVASGGNDGAFGVSGGRITRASGAIARSPVPRPRGGGGTAEPTPDALLAAIESDVATAIASVAAAQAVTQAADAQAEAAEEAAAIEAAAAEAAAATLAAATAAALQAGTAAEGEEVAQAEATPPRIAPRPRPATLAAAAPPEGEAEAAQVDVAAAEPDAAAVPADPQVAVAPATAAVVAEAPADPAVDPASAVRTDIAEASVPALPEAGAAAPLALADPAATALALAPEAASALEAPAPEAASDVAAAPAEDAGAVRLASAAVLTPDLMAGAPALPEPVLRPEPEAPEVVTRASTSGGRHSGISLGRFPSRFEAEKILIATALADPGGLGGALRRIVQRGGGFEASFMGLSSEQAGLACRRLSARGKECATIGE